MTEIIIVCAWCKEKMKQAETWTDLVIEVLERDEVIISHGLCPECGAGVMQALEVEVAQREMALANY